MLSLICLKMCGPLIYGPYSRKNVFRYHSDTHTLWIYVTSLKRDVSSKHVNRGALSMSFSRVHLSLLYLRLTGSMESAAIKCWKVLQQCPWFGWRRRIPTIFWCKMSSDWILSKKLPNFLQKERDIGASGGYKDVFAPAFAIMCFSGRSFVDQNSFWDEFWRDSLHVSSTLVVVAGVLLPAWYLLAAIPSHISWKKAMPHAATLVS